MLRIRLLGPVSIQQEGQRPADLSAKALELLSYLLLNRNRAHPREGLSGVLWPDATSSLSRKYLRQTLWLLQSTPACADLLHLTPGWVSVDVAGTWWFDVAAFEQAYAASRDLDGYNLTEPQARAIEDAVALYRGDLLETLYQDWCIYERERLQLTYLVMLEKLMGYCARHGLYGQGVAHGQRILRCDPARESTHRELMRLHHRAGDRTTALRQFDRCAQALAREFDLAPAPETVALRERIRTDGNGVVEAPSSRHLDELHRQLESVQAIVSALGDQVQQMLASEPQARPQTTRDTG